MLENIVLNEKVQLHKEDEVSKIVKFTESSMVVARVGVRYYLC